jgi:hypothetical protein
MYRSLSRNDNLLQIFTLFQSRHFLALLSKQSINKPFICVKLRQRSFLLLLRDIQTENFRTTVTLIFGREVCGLAATSAIVTEFCPDLA